LGCHSFCCTTHYAIDFSSLTALLKVSWLRFVSLSISKFPFFPPSSFFLDDQNLLCILSKGNSRSSSLEVFWLPSSTKVFVTESLFYWKYPFHDVRYYESHRLHTQFFPLISDSFLVVSTMMLSHHLDHP